MNLNDPISSIKGVGRLRAKIFNDLEIFSIEDMLYYFPRRHLDRTVVTPIGDLKKGERYTIVADVQTLRERPTRNGKMFQIIVSDGTGILTLNWFNGVRYIKNLFKIKEKLAINGKVEWYKGFSITHPECDKLQSDEDPISSGKIIPIYPLNQEMKSAGIDQRRLRSIMKNILGNISSIPERMPRNTLNKNGLINLEKALSDIHFSKNLEDLDSAVRRLKFDEHFFLQLLLALRKKSLESKTSKRLIDVGPYFRTISEDLEFELTKAQKNVIQDVHLDMKKGLPMNRLIQGDVGSGKTIVAILISVIAAGNNVQIAVMAPTEILASQHYRSFKKHLDKVKIPCAILIGKMKKSERIKIIDGLSTGKISIVVGTHALIQDDISFKNLGLIIIDEQHRFGVKQRSALLNKGSHPHALAMTATPIPRTLAITYNGDMDISVIDELPLNRIPIVTKIVEPSRMNRVYKFIRDEVSLGRQCMVVYPLIEESEKIDLSAAKSAYEDLSKIHFPNLKVGLLHGKMKAEEKNMIIKNFEGNTINILVSTTVIEVGVDIPNASVMLIEHSERFGLTQLHQLRGRVGRGAKKSYCILVRRNFSESSRNRLSIMETTNDGFTIADEDLKIRGPGEFFGTRQSGFFKFKIANMVTDGKLIRRARKEAFSIVKNDPNLSSLENFKIKNHFISNYKQYLEDVNLL